MRKGYSILPQPLVVDELPDGWVEAEDEHRYTVTLLAFAWALLPVGFMVLMSLFDRYEQHRLTLAAVALVLLVLAFVSGVGQRKSALLDGRVQLATASLTSAGVLLAMLFALDLATYWWVVYGLVFGSVATMYVSLNHLASCNAPTFRLPWDVAVPVPSDALTGWRIVNGRWTNVVIATKATKDGTVLTLHGDLLNGATFLFFERLCLADASPKAGDMGIDFAAFASRSDVHREEE